jgi:D-lactate dehydrogenase (cytochrome)
MMAAFDSVEQAGEAVSAVIAEGLVPATMEMMNQQMMRIIEDYAHAGLPVDAGAALIIEADGFPESVGPQIEEIATILRAYGGFNLHIAESAEERDKIWYGRKSAAGAMARLAPAYYLVDGTVPRSKLAETLHGVNQICEEARLNVAYVFHAGDGNLHPFIPIADPRDQALIKKVVAAGRDILALCVGMGGSITGEHGVGIEKREFMPLMYSNDELDVMREIRDIFDPTGVFNPGKVFPESKDTADTETGRQGDKERRTDKASGQTAPQDHSIRSNSTFAAPAASLHSDFPVRVSPATAAEAAGMLQTYTAEGRTIRILGAGTKSAGLPQTEVVVSTAGMRGIRTYARDDLFVTVGAGTSLAELQAELARDRMWAPMASPWPASTVGGIVATSFNAPLRQRYGGLRDIVLAATVALPDGRTIRAGRPVVKNVAGYDLPKLFVGSFGTLGLITDVTLKLGPLPRARTSLLVPIDDLAQGLNVGARLLPICLNASALLVIRPTTRSQGSMTLVYTAEGHPDDIAAEMAQVRAALHDAGITGAEETEEASGTDLWANWLAEPGDTTLRIGVGARELPETLLALQKAGAGKPSFVADLASGLLYLRGVPVADARRAAKAARGYAVALNTVAADGDPWGHTPDGLNLMQTLRDRFGAGGLLNPGAFLV